MALFLLFSVIDSFGWFWIESLLKNNQLKLLSILSPTLFVLYINDVPEDVICDIAIYVDDTTLYTRYDQASDLWQQIELASELDFDLRDTGLGQEVAC